MISVYREACSSEGTEPLRFFYWNEGGEGIEKKKLWDYLFSVFDIYHVFLFGVGSFLCEGFQYDCEYHFEKAWLGEAGERLLFL